MIDDLKQVLIRRYLLASDTLARFDQDPIRWACRWLQGISSFGRGWSADFPAFLRNQLVNTVSYGSSNQLLLLNYFARTSGRQSRIFRSNSQSTPPDSATGLDYADQRYFLKLLYTASTNLSVVQKPVSAP